MPDILIIHTSSGISIAQQLSEHFEAENLRSQLFPSTDARSTQNAIQEALFIVPVVAADIHEEPSFIQVFQIALERHKWIMPVTSISYDELPWELFPSGIGAMRWFSVEEQDIALETLTAMSHLCLQNYESIKTYTHYYNAAVLWEKYGYQSNHLIPRKSFLPAWEWLIKHSSVSQFLAPLTTLHQAYLCESKRNLDNEISDIYILHTDNIETLNAVVYALQAKGVTCVSKDLPQYQHLEADKAIENASVCVLIGSQSEEAQELAENQLLYVNSLNKLILQYNHNTSVYPSLQLETIKEGELPACDADETKHLKLHTLILQRARQWQRNNQVLQGLLYGYDLTIAIEWYEESANYPMAHPLGIHEEYIEESKAKAIGNSPDVFLINASNDLPLAKTLNQHLQLNGVITFWPYEKLQFAQQAEEVIYHGIHSSDLFVVVLTSQIIKRAELKSEIRYAQRLHKKIVGVLVEEIDRMDFPEYLQNIQLCNLSDSSLSWKERLNLLMPLLADHRAYEQTFQKVEQWTANWISHDQSPDFLIPENELDEIEKWYHEAISASRVPTPTELHYQYIEQSRQHITQLLKKEHRELVRFRIALAAAVGLLLLTIVLLVNAAWQSSENHQLYQEAEQARQLAQKNEQQLAEQLARNKLLVDSLRSLDQFARLQQSERDSIIREYLYARNIQVELAEENEVLSKETSFFKGDMEIVEFMKELREKYRSDKTDKTVAKAYYDVVMSRRLNPGHNAPIHHVEATPDGKFVLTSGGDGKARLFDIANNRVRSFTQNRYNGMVYSAVFSKDGKQVLTASHDGTAILWDVAGVKQIQKFSCGNNILFADFSHHGRWVLTTENKGKVTVWDIQSGKKMRELIHEEAVSMAFFSPNNASVYTACADGNVRKWTLKDGEMEVVVTGSTQIHSLVLAPNGKEFIAGLQNGSAIRYNLSGSVLGNFRGHQREVLFATYSPDGTKVITTSADRSARVWERTSGKLICVLGRNREHLGKITGAAFSADGNRVFTCSADRSVRLWWLSPSEVFEGNNLEEYLKIGAQ